MNDDDFFQPNQAFEPNRQRVTIDVDALVQQGDVVYRIAQMLDFESVIGINVETGRSTPLRIGDLRPVAEQKDTDLSVYKDLDEIADEDWKIAQKRFAAISPLVGRDLEGSIGRQDVERRAKEVSASTATLYRWIKRYNAYGSVTALIPKKRGWKEGNYRISRAAEAVVE
ncbi:MAG: helix-turn-helix domain-containing protein, partial [Azoarcus sp.]|nr:helix-turn-helix domain-containing protein [Azoarcus sp.]